MRVCNLHKGILAYNGPLGPRPLVEVLEVAWPLALQVIASSAKKFASFPAILGLMPRFMERGNNSGLTNKEHGAWLRDSKN